MSLDADTESWLRLSLIPGIGAASILKLLKAFGAPDAALNASQASLTAVLRPKQISALRAPADQAALEKALAWLSLPGNRLLTLADADFPAALLNIADPPPVLYAKGKLACLKHPGLAIVGSRSATPQGLANAEAFGRELSRQGWCIVSGLASGVDAAAHRGGLAGVGSTIAVVGTGLDIVYPASNHALAHDIAAHGLLLSEFPLGTPGKASNFPRRNRIISGLARGVLVVEAALQSGSLITAREAAEQGREVFAIPGSIHAPLAKGCHQLIKQGAKLVESAMDILDELGDARPAPSANELAVSTPPQDQDGASLLLAAMGFDPIDVETLCQRANLTVEQAYAMLLLLELDGKVGKLIGGNYQRLC